jgi:DNA-binding phage protein
MNDVTNLLTALERQQTFTEIAKMAGVSRNTVYNVRKNPENSTLKVLKSVFGAMGYNLVLSLEKKKEAR